jgi:uncharacterized heparinase superfamily protein
VVRLGTDGRSLDGEDSFAGPDGKPLPPRTADEFAVRFHLHPALKASRLSDGYGVILMLPDREVWTFSSFGDPVQIEESVYLSAADGPRRTTQIVIYGRARERGKVRWLFRHTPRSEPGGRPDREAEPELPL